MILLHNSKIQLGLNLEIKVINFRLKRETENYSDDVVGLLGFTWMMASFHRKRSPKVPKILKAYRSLTFSWILLNFKISSLGFYTFLQKLYVSRIFFFRVFLQDLPFSSLNKMMPNYFHTIWFRTYSLFSAKSCLDHKFKLSRSWFQHSGNIYIHLFILCFCFFVLSFFCFFIKFWRTNYSNRSPEFRDHKSEKESGKNQNCPSLGHVVKRRVRTHLHSGRLPTCHVGSGQVVWALWYEG